MKRTPCHYAVLRFRPYAETGEFVNVGLAVVAPEADEFAYFCSARRRRRVGQFFPELDSKVFRAAMDGMAAELKRLKEMLTTDLTNKVTPDEAVLAFRELTRPREGLLTFGNPGTLLAPSIESAMDQLNARYIERQFAQKPEYQEVAMQRVLGQLLGELRLKRLYRSQSVGDERFHITLPFVYEREGRVAKALKPLDLDRKDATDVYQHGGQWVTALKRLVEFDHAPEQMVFPVHRPKLTAEEAAWCVPPPRFAAAEEIARELEAAGAAVVDFENKAGLEKAVRIEGEGLTALSGA